QVQPVWQRHQQVAALGRELIQAARIQISTRTLGDNLISEFANSWDWAVRRIDRPRHRVEVEQRLGQERQFRGKTESTLEGNVDRIVQHLAGVELADRKVVVARHETRDLADVSLAIEPGQ